jgi:hypothetical protein
MSMRFHFLVLTSSLLLVPGFSGDTLAQQASTETKEIQPTDWIKLEASYKDKKFLFAQVRDGTADAKENAEAIDVGAKFYSYRVTWPTSQSIQPAGGAMDTVYRDFEKDITLATKAKSDVFLQMLGEKMAKYSKDVIDNNSKVIARVNAIRLVARLAEAGIDETADLLIDEANKNDQFEAVKYYALKGLRGLIAAASQPKSTVFTSPKGKERETKAIQALVAMVERKPPIPEALTPEEMNGFRKVRLQAIEALAVYRKPALLDEKGAIKLPVALSLLEVLKKEGMTPEPRIEEQVAAAVGLARMRAKGMPAYQADYAASQFAPFVVEFASRYQDKVNGGRDAKEPWKYYAARLIEAYDEFRTENTVSKDLIAVIDQCLTVLNGIEENQQVNPGELKQWLGEHPPKTATSLFKGLPDVKAKDAAADGKTDDKAKAAKPPEPEKK